MSNNPSLITGYRGAKTQLRSPDPISLFAKQGPPEDSLLSDHCNFCFWGGEQRWPGVEFAALPIRRRARRFFKLLMSSCFPQRREGFMRRLYKSAWTTFGYIEFIYQ